MSMQNLKINKKISLRHQTPGGNKNCNLIGASPSVSIRSKQGWLTALRTCVVALCVEMVASSTHHIISKKIMM